ncbi:hypothetical protein [Corynebacterium lowii]|uniref:Uncharacterized protein n=1 Tax=Corynebacterium lowii TaxID=1544413 RepID=A0A0Q0YVM6_9CORY|nr:hypothetical protein [Corynebacterium lowii]KQB86390.1 hypothetical protein Clow_01310 [Corynebacterium lowii]MDP9850875.1 putative membrane protein [Corynebacterium lowii]
METQKNTLVLGWVAAVLALAIGFFSWTVPDSWYGTIDYAFMAALVVLAAVSGWCAWKNRSAALAIAAVVGLLSPIIVIVASMVFIGL